jgi:hypothetical protein
MWSGRGIPFAADADGDADADADRDVDGTVDVVAGFVRAGWQPATLSETTMARVRIRARRTVPIITNARVQPVR